MSLVESQVTEVTDQDRAELQSHFPYAGVKLSELSVQEERLILYFIRGMSKAAAGRAAGYRNLDHVYEVFKKPKINQAISYLREEMREEIKFDKNTATQMYLEAHRKSATSTEEKNVVDSLCKLHGLFAPEQATQVNINVDKIQQLERLPDSELLKLAGVDTQYLEPKGGTND
jgi:phage terminase small subunit|tara:strand:- start:1499 stop:2017 length:519 start_codon:yes stop_codon:yes gene_type:complete